MAAALVEAPFGGIMNLISLSDDQVAWQILLLSLALVMLRSTKTFLERCKQNLACAHPHLQFRIL